MRATAAVPDRGMKAEEVSRDNEDPARTCTSSLSAPPAAPVGDPSLGIGGREVTFRLVHKHFHSYQWRHLDIQFKCTQASVSKEGLRGQIVL